jgi:hypothetical protein
MDHYAADVYACLIEPKAKRMFFIGKIRSHGRLRGGEMHRHPAQKDLNIDNLAVLYFSGPAIDLSQPSRSADIE